MSFSRLKLSLRCANDESQMEVVQIYGDDDLATVEGKCSICQSSIMLRKQTPEDLRDLFTFHPEVFESNLRYKIGKLKGPDNAQEVGKPV